MTWSSTSPSPSSTTSYVSGPPPSNHQATFERPLSPHGYNTTYATLPAGARSNNSTSASAPLPTVTSPSVDAIPPSRRRVNPNSARDKESGAGRGHGPGSAGSSRGNGTPVMGVSKPTGILKCSSCKTTQSPEWRKGPSGKKELCNALVAQAVLILKFDLNLYRCGLRYARSKAKKEGPLAPPARRRKDKTDLSKRESATPPSYAPQNGSSRRGFDYGTSSHSGGEAYGIQPRQNQHVLDGQLSPSPPLSTSGPTSVSLVHYAGGHGQRLDNHHRPPPPFSSSSNTLYTPSSPVQSTTQNYSPHSIPSPSVTSIYHQHNQPHHPHHSHHMASYPQLPPLEHIKPPHAYDRDMREQQSPHQGQRIAPSPLSAGEGRDGYRR